MKKTINSKKKGDLYDTIWESMKNDRYLVEKNKEGRITKVKVW